MPIYEYVAEHCLESLYCPKRFAFRQRMEDPPVRDCPTCGVPLTRVLSSFSARGDLAAHIAAVTDPPAGSSPPPATIKNMFGGGLGVRGCGHDHSR
jgi:putative FmdB family regulatory protein